MLLNLSLAMVPIQNLLSLADLLPKLHHIGVRNAQDAERLVVRPDHIHKDLTPDDMTSITAALEQLKAEQQFVEKFNWDLLAYSPVVQAEFALKAPKVFDPAYIETRLIYLSIPTRTLRALEGAELDTVGEVLASQAALLEMRNLGERSVGELFRILGQFARVYRFMLGNLWSVTQRRLTPPALLKAIVGPLKDRERDVINKRYGLQGKELTLRETGEALGISRERARQIQSRTMEKLREGSSLALIHDWVDVHLPHLIHRSMMKLGGLANAEKLINSVSSTGFSLTLICDILDIELPALFARVELARAGQDLWCINKPFSRLAFDAVRAIHAPGRKTNLDPAPDSVVEAIIADYRTEHPVASRYPPSPTFIRNVLRHLDDFSLALDDNNDPPTPDP